jgi:hypothetical protein
MSTVQRVRAWCDQHKQSLKRTLVGVTSKKVVFYFVPAAARYDLALGDHMTDLEVSLATAGIGYVETMQVPEKSPDRFVGDASLELWRRDDKSA